MWAASASAASFTVTSQDDANDGTCDADHCSLREAILAGNATNATDEVRFISDEPITPATPLPAITRTTFITTLPSARCDTDSAPLRLRGRGADFAGLVFAPGSDGSHICLASVGGFRTGIEFHSEGNAIRLSHIGTTPDGTSDDPNRVAGIVVAGDRNLIGGDFSRSRNTISGNGQVGVDVQAGAGNQIAGNLIGTDAAQLAELPNDTGVRVGEDATDTLVGAAPPRAAT